MYSCKVFNVIVLKKLLMKLCSVGFSLLSYRILLCKIDLNFQNSNYYILFYGIGLTLVNWVKILKLLNISRLCTKGGMVAIVTSAKCTKCTRPSVARAVFNYSHESNRYHVARGAHDVLCPNWWKKSRCVRVRS